MPSRVSPHVGIKASLPIASLNRATIPTYNASTVPRMQAMAARPYLTADTARHRVPVHSGQAERACDKLFDAVCTTSEMHTSKMTSVRTHMWQQNRQLAQPQNCRLQPQPVSAYVAQQQRLQAPVSGCGTVLDWSSRFNGQSPYQQSERLPHHQQQQQRFMMPSGTMIRQQLPTYQNVIGQHHQQDMVLKHTWQQQQQRHLMHLQSASQHHRYVVASVAGESYDVSAFRQAASSDCSNTLAVSSTA